ncbi:MAG: hypothetical protein IPO95_12985 [Rhodanobacteraceae bacterium]|nr:hypothetical protein [Rhodanobacteraceae bacterium]MBL0040347.1 hypothetical protein [Xanthomonadales bacterium]MBP6078644.1 hypothetical protein [Xanthomonadales bacterium]
MFPILGCGVLAYTAFALLQGRVHAKSGWQMREIHRMSRPRYFWTVIVCYAALGIALITVF